MTRHAGPRFLTFEIVFSDKNIYCSGHGACLTMREMAQYKYNDQKVLEPVSYDTIWDAKYVTNIQFSNFDLSVKICVFLALSEDVFAKEQFLSIIDIPSWNPLTTMDIFRLMVHLAIIMLQYIIKHIPHDFIVDLSHMRPQITRISIAHICVVLQGMIP